MHSSSSPVAVHLEIRFCCSSDDDTDLSYYFRTLFIYVLFSAPFSVSASDYGMRLPILRSNPEDQVLYQTERYNEDTFGYEVPIREEGEYILVMKFAEVYFAQSQQKVSLKLPLCCSLLLLSLFYCCLVCQSFRTIMPGRECV